MRRLLEAQRARAHTDATRAARLNTTVTSMALAVNKVLINRLVRRARPARQAWRLPLTRPL